jgi:hypothetical protein
VRQPQAVICGLVAAAIAHPAGAQQHSDAARSIERPLTSAVERVASDPATWSQRPAHRRIPKGFLWTGVGLLSYGGLLIFLGAGYGPDHFDCPRGDCRVCTPDCPKSQDILYRGARPFLASGAAVIAVGAVIGATRSPDLMPRISLDRGGVAIHQAVPLHRWWRRAPTRE